MSNTHHHNAPKKPHFLHLEETRTGWKGEDCYRQEGRKFIKQQEHRANRRYGKRLTKMIDSSANCATMAI